MTWLRFSAAALLFAQASAADAADELCAKLDGYAKAQWAEKGVTIPRHWVEFHWGNDPDPRVVWSWGCGHSEDKSSIDFCKWLMDNTNQEFRSELPIRVQRCIGYDFPPKSVTEWQFTDGTVRHLAPDGSWLVLEVSSQGMRPGESAVRISFDSIDRKLDPGRIAADEILSDVEGPAGRDPMTDNPTLSPQRQPEDADAALRPKSLGEFVRQEAGRCLEPLSKGLIQPPWVK